MGFAARNCFADEVLHCAAPFAMRAAPERLPNGNVIVDGVQFFKIGKGFEQRGGAGKFDFTDKNAEEIVRNFNEDKAEGYDVFLTIGHPDRLDMAEAVAWVKELRHKPGVGVFARVEVDKDFFPKIETKKFRYFSPTFSLKARDMYGRQVGAKLWTGGILNNPFWTGMVDFSAVLSSQVGLAMKVKVRAKKDDGTDVPQDERLANLEAAVTELASGLEAVTKLNDTVQELSNRLKPPKEKPEEKETSPEVTKLAKELEGTRTELASVTRANLSRDVVKVLELARTKGVFKRSQLGPKWKTEEFDGADWLENSNFKDLKSLINHVRTSDPVIDLSDTKESSGGDDDALELSGFDNPKSPDVIQLAAQLKCSPEDIVRRSRPGYRPGIQ